MSIDSANDSQRCYAPLTKTGMRLTEGQLLVDQYSFISSEATVNAQAISFGDGVMPSNNLLVRIFPAANFELQQGIVLYNDA